MDSLPEEGLHAASGGNVVKGDVLVTGANNVIGGQSVFEPRSSTVNRFLQDLGDHIGRPPEVDRNMKPEITAGTCEWILKDPRFISWSSNPSMPLWIAGAPGKGKSMLAKFISQELESQCKQLKMPTIYVFCSKFNDRSTPLAFVKVLLYQLIGLHTAGFEHIEESFERQGSSMFNKHDFTELWAKLQTVVNRSNLPMVFCIIDALDECVESLEPFYQALEKTFGGEGCDAQLMRAKFKLLITSRHNPRHMCEELASPRLPRIDLNTSPEVQQDLQAYITDQITILRKHKGLPKAFEDQLQHNLENNAEGTFLWVGLVCRRLREMSPPEMLDASTVIPRELGALYNDILSRVPQARAAKVMNIMQYMCVAARPLRADELAYLVRPESVIGYSTTESLTYELDYCEGLVSVERHCVFLLHDTLREHLICGRLQGLHQFRVDQSFVHRCFIEKCFDTFEDFASSPQSFEIANHPLGESNRLSKRKRAEMRHQYCHPFPFADYAIFYWTYHVGSTQAECDFERPLFSSDDGLRGRVNLFIALRRYNFVSMVQYIEEAKAQPLFHFACDHGLLDLLNQLLDRGADLTERDEQYRNGLYLFMRRYQNLLDLPGPALKEYQSRQMALLDRMLNQLQYPADEALRPSRVTGHGALSFVLHDPELICNFLHKASVGSSALKNDLECKWSPPLLEVLGHILWYDEPRPPVRWEGAIRAMLELMSVDDINKPTNTQSGNALFFCCQSGDAFTTNILLEAGADPFFPVQVWRCKLQDRHIPGTPLHVLDELFREPRLDNSEASPQDIWHDPPDGDGGCPMNMYKRRSYFEDEHYWLEPETQDGPSYRTPRFMTPFEQVLLRGDKKKLKLFLPLYEQKLGYIDEELERFAESPQKSLEQLTGLKRERITREEAVRLGLLSRQMSDSSSESQSRRSSSSE